MQAAGFRGQMAAAVVADKVESRRAEAAEGRRGGREPARRARRGIRSLAGVPSRCHAVDGPAELCPRRVGRLRRFERRRTGGSSVPMLGINEAG